jgi:hypothetical protein
MILVRILVGIGLLTLGRRLFWLFVGLIGFIWAIRIAAHFFPGHSDWMILCIALMAGVLGALLTVFLQRLAIGLAGFSAGVYIAIRLLHVSGWGTQVDWLVFLIGGILGVVLIFVLFDWALIILSSLLGAGLITETIRFGESVMTLLFIALFLSGVLVQSRSKKRK